MADAKHLEILGKGPEEWNIYVTTKPANFRADLAEANLNGANLFGARLGKADLNRADLAEADLAEANLAGANLAGANLTGAVLTGADLSGAILDEANLFEANLAEANLFGARLGKANLFGARLGKADLFGARLGKARLGKADLNGADFNGADLGEANLNGADLAGANLNGADLAGANLSGVDLNGIELTEAYLPGADLAGANLAGANLSGVDLNGVDLAGANLNGADLTGADLSGAILDEANLGEANLNGADLAGADLDRAKYDASTIWPESFDPEVAGAIKTENQRGVDKTDNPSNPDESPQTITNTEPAVKQGWGQVVRIDSFESQERLQIASRSVEVILGYFRQVLDDETLDGLDLGVLQSEYDVLTALARNPKGLNPQRVEQTIAEAMKVLVPQLSEEPATNNFLNAVQRLGTPDPQEDGEVLIEVVEAAADIAAIEANEEPQTTETDEEKERSFGRRVLDGMDNNAEELGKKILVDVVPDTAAKAVIAAATVATFAAAGKAALALKAIVDFVISIIG